MGNSSTALLKWAGSKRRLAARVASFFPANMQHFVDPFCGSCSVYLHLYQQGFRGTAVLSDLTAPLTSFLREVARDPQAVLAEYERLRSLPQTQETYLHVRSHPPLLATPFAGWFLYINRAGFNGLWRLNRSGGFNVPWGKHLTLPDVTDAVCEAAVALQHAQLLSAPANFLLHNMLKGPEGLDLTGTVVYLDPPYLETFSDYTAAGFDRREHEALAATIAVLQARGAACFISGSDTEATHHVYGSLGRAVRLDITHSISRGSRPPIREVLFCPEAG